MDRISRSIVGPRSFAWHLGALTLGLVLPALIFMGILLARFSALEKARIEGEARVLARTLALTVAQQLNDRVTTLQALATSPSLKANDLSTFYRQIKALQEQQGYHYGLRDLSGDVLISTRVPFEQPIPRVEEAVRASDAAALVQRAPHVSDIYFGPVSRIANITISVPVLQQEPPVLVVGASLDAARFESLLQSLTVPDGWSIGLTDRSSTVVARVPAIPSIVGRKASSIFQANAQQGVGMYYGSNYLREPSLVAYDTVPGADWRVSVTVPQAEINGLIYRSVLALIAVGLGLGIIGALLATMMRQRLLRSVASVEALATRFRDARSTVTTDAPVSEIANVSRVLMDASRDLRANEARFRGVFESTLMGFTIYDANTGETLAVNDRFLAMTGHTRADFDEGRWDWRAFTPRDFLPLDEAATLQAKERGWWEPYEKELIRVDGTRFPIRISSAPLPGEPGRVVVSIEDVSATRAAEQGLRESERRLQLAKQAAKLGVWDWNLKSGHIDWSPEMFDVLGVPHGIADGDLLAAWREVLHPEDRGWTQEVLERTIETGEPFTMDFRIGGKGNVRWVRSQSVAVVGADGRPDRLTGVVLDVTTQHEREEGLEREAARLATAVEERTRERDRIFELSTDLFAVMGYDGGLKVINPAWSRLLGFSEEEILARPSGVAIHPEDQARVAALIATLRSGQSVQGFENRLITADGGLVSVSWTCVPGSDDNFYAVGRDITKEREREEILRQSQKMEAVGQLTGGIAHDFNNLLGAVMGGFDLIRRKPNDAERVQRLAEHGLAAAERGAKLTGQLLAFSRLQKLELKPVMPAELIANMRDLLSRTLGPAVQVDLDLRCQTWIRTDAVQLEMAILNLAINARDAMPAGGAVTIGCCDRMVADDPELAQGAYVELSVRDTGMGMAPDIVAKAFNPFFTTKGLGKGTGLGLSQVYSMAMQGGGGVRIESQVGAGTIVRILLPRSEAAVGMQRAADAEPLSPFGASATVMIVDDDQDMRRTLLETLDTLGYAVVEADCGEAALRLFGPANPEAVILDYAMPGLNGAEVAKMMRAQRPNVPIIFASGYSETRAIESAVGKPFRLLSKPFRTHELQAALLEALPAKPH